MIEPQPKCGRVMGIDPGERRVGVAISDPGRSLATGVTTLDARNWGLLIKLILEIIETQHIQTVVIGYPLTLKGNRGKLVSQAEKLSDLLISKGIEVILWDERFSSKAARQNLIRLGIKTGHHKGEVDRKAAEWILQAYLDSLEP